jgi:hypothetical protein
MKQDSNIVLTVLAILSILSFTRTLLYEFFSKTELNIAKDSNMDVEKILDRTLSVFSFLRIILASIALGLRGVHMDILTIVLVFFILSSVQRACYEYMLSYYPKSRITYYLTHYQRVNTFLVFASSLYIMKYLLF